MISENSLNCKELLRVVGAEEYFAQISSIKC